jgi:hypothetical protein
MNILCTESSCPQKAHSRTLLFDSTHPKHCRHFNYWNQPLNICMCTWYLDCHEAELCCYLVIHIGNILYPLQLFYFHLWPIYWLIHRHAIKLWAHYCVTWDESWQMKKSVWDCHIEPGSKGTWKHYMNIFHYEFCCKVGSFFDSVTNWLAK